MQQLTARNFWILYSLGVLFMLLALRFHYVGEEPIFPIETQEMWEQGVWFKKLIYGQDVLQPPLFNWLIAAFTQLVGWVHIKEVARVLTIAFTAGTGLMLGWLALKLSGDRLFSAVAATTYLTFQDVLLYHGWLAYVDPSFAFFIFSAIALAWVAAREQSRPLLALSMLAIICAFLSKSPTSYVFYGSALFVLLFQAGPRRFLLRPMHLAAFLIPLAFPLLWYAMVPGGSGQGSGMLGEIMDKLRGGGASHIGLGQYLLGRLLYLLETLSELFPLGWLALWLVLRRPGTLKVLPEYVQTAGWIALLAYLPYWLSPSSGIRYLMPIYPLFALIAAAILWQAGSGWISRARYWMLGMLAVQLTVFLIAFPLYQKHYRGDNYWLAAEEIARISQTQPLYSNNAASNGLIVTAYLNVLRFPLPAVQASPGAQIGGNPAQAARGAWDNGFVIALSPDLPDTKVSRQFVLPGGDLYLLCRGAACAQTP
jgi:4-amino-4-deoxy-L-arabinose transferase-like glycosyltransferase